jgi:hypothetical protein
LIIVNAPSAMHANYCLLLQDFEGELVPRAVRTLGPGFLPVTVRRTDSHTLEIEPRGGYLGLFLDRLFRNEQHPLRAGEQIVLPRMTARVISVTQDGRPNVVSFRFDCVLEDPSLRWILWRGDGFAPFAPPAVGRQIEIIPRQPSLGELISER